MLLLTVISHHRKQKKPRCVIIAKISMALSAYAIPYLCGTIPTLLSSEDKPPYRISIFDNSDLKGDGAIEDAAKVRI
jgi:hypothetical protein